jgi:salicylate hydroxylase
MIGEDNPAALPGFTHMVAYRAVIPLEAVVAAMGEDKGYSHCLHVGPGAYTVTYPVRTSSHPQNQSAIYDVSTKLMV